MRCTHCGDVIGVYEPLIAISDGRAYETSLAAGTPGAGHRTDCFHRTCYDAHRLRTARRRVGASEVSSSPARYGGFARLRTRPPAE
jgi:hypothetical protein